MHCFNLLYTVMDIRCEKRGLPPFAVLIWGVIHMSLQRFPQGLPPETAAVRPIPAPSAFVFKAPVSFVSSDVKVLRPEIERLAKLNVNVVMDFARTETIDGSGVGALVYVFKRLAVGGKRLSIRNVSGQPLTLLNSAGLLRTLSVVDRPEGLLRATVRWLRLRRRRRAAAPVAVAETLSISDNDRSKGVA